MRLLVTVAIASFLLTSNAARAQDKNAANDPHRTSTTQNNNPSAPPPTVEINIGTQVNTAQSQPAKTGPYYEPRPITLGELLIAVITAIYSIFSVFTYFTIRKQADLSQRLASLERPWLVAYVGDTVEQLAKQLGRGNPIYRLGFEWKVKNCGRTPAFVLRIGSRLHRISNFSDLAPEPDINGAQLQSTVIYPGGKSLGPGDSMERWSMIESHAPNTQNDFDDALEGRFIWIAYGVVEYRTILDDTVREMRFCYRWMPGGGPDTFLPSPIPSNYTRQT